MLHEEVKKYRELSGDTNPNTPISRIGGYLDGYEKALEQTRWIPVSERLPEKNMRCLVAVGRFNFTQIAMYSDLMGTIDHRIFYQGDYGDGNFENITQYVKAWMPLPKPYEPQESEVNNG